MKATDEERRTQRLIANCRRVIAFMTDHVDRFDSLPPPPRMRVISGNEVALFTLLDMLIEGSVRDGVAPGRAVRISCDLLDVFCNRQRLGDSMTTTTEQLREAQE